MCYGGPLVTEHQPANKVGQSPRTKYVNKHCRRVLLTEFRSNPQFLLQKCLHYDWKTVEQICLLLIYYFDRQRHIETCATQLLAVDRWGNTPLHAACYFRPTGTVVDLLLQAAKLYQVPMTTTVNNKGTNPLVIACSSGAPLRVIQSLLDCDSNLNSCVDSDGTTPLVALARRYQMMRSIPKFSKKCTPLERITKEEVLEEERICRRFHNTGQADDVIDAVKGDFDAEKVFHLLWIKMNAMIQVGWNSRDKNHQKSIELRRSQHSILHRTAFIAGLLPPVLTDLMIRSHEELVSRDSDGILPLHLAVTVDSITCNPTVLENRAFFIRKLLQVDPETAAVVIPSTGRLPLIEAIASGLPWNQVEHTTHDTPNIDLEQKGPLQLLWDASPDAANQIDPVTGLRPFMLAAAVVGRDDNAASGIDTIYSLLKLDPSGVLCN